MPGAWRLLMARRLLDANFVVGGQATHCPEKADKTDPHRPLMTLD